MVADERSDYVNAYLNGFLDKPFQTFVVFGGCYGNVEVVVAATIVGDTLCDSVNSTYQTIKANPGIQRKRIAELTGKSIPTIDRHIALLAKSNFIEHRDSDKTGGYYVKK